MVEYLDWVMVSIYQIVRMVWLVCLLACLAPVANAKDDFCGGSRPSPLAVIHQCGQAPGAICTCREHSICECSVQSAPLGTLAAPESAKFPLVVPAQTSWARSPGVHYVLPSPLQARRVHPPADVPEPPPPRSVVSEQTLISTCDLRLRRDYENSKGVRGAAWCAPAQYCNAP